MFEKEEPILIKKLRKEIKTINSIKEQISKDAKNFLEVHKE